MKTKNYKFSRAIVCTLLSILLCLGFIVAPQAKALALTAGAQDQSSTAAGQTTADATNSQNATSTTADATNSQNAASTTADATNSQNAASSAEGAPTSLNATSSTNKHYTDISVVPLEQQLKETEGIKYVSPFTSQTCKEAYIFYVEQPLDWNNPNGDKFLQRVMLMFNSQSGINIYECGGYTIQFAGSSPIYFGNNHNENYIGIEYRFFDGSRPEGLTNTEASASTWQNLCTSWQMANDIHNIYQKLNTILSGKSALFGVSKGGYVTNYQAYFQDTYNVADFDAFYPFCAPFCTSLDDNRIFTFTQNKVGDEWFGTEKAKQYRDAIFNYEMECYKYKPELSKMIDETVFPADKEENINTSFYTTDAATRRAKLFDFALGNYAVSIWQQYKDETIFSTLEQVVAMPESTEDEKAAKIQALFDTSKSSFTGVNSVTFYWNDILASPYYIQAYAFMGENTYLYGNLRSAITQKGWDEDHQVTLTTEEEKGLALQASVQKSLREMLTYSQDEYNKLLAWNNNCKQKVFRVYGALDPWYATRIPDVTSNGSIKTYVAPGMGHATQPKDLTAEDKKDFDANYEAALCSTMDEVDVALEGTSFTYTGSAITPAVSVNMNGVIVSPDNYNVEYLNNVEVGTATVRVTGTRGFSGTIDKTFTINAAGSDQGSSISGATASTGDHNADVAWPIVAVLVVSGVTCVAAVRRMWQAVR